MISFYIYIYITLKCEYKFQNMKLNTHFTGHLKEFNWKMLISYVYKIFFIKGLF